LNRFRGGNAARCIIGRHCGSLTTAAKVKTPVAKPTTPSLVVPTRNPTNLPEEISDIHHHQLYARLEMTRRFLTSISSLQTGKARPRAVLMFVKSFLNDYNRTVRCKACASPAGMRTECDAGGLNWSIVSASTVSKFLS